MTDEESSYLYHYCSIESFFNIIDSKSLWFSDSRFMNDSTEAKYFTQTLAKELEEIDKIDSEDLQDIKKIITPSYICCFSKKGNLLSQWRAYADDGCGIAIGFKESIFPYKNYFRKIEVNYDLEEKIEECKKQYNDFCPQKGSISENLDKFLKENNNQDEKNLKITELQNFFNTLHFYNTKLKHNAFKEEDETRLSFNRPPDLESDLNSYYFLKTQLKYRPSNKMIIPYYERSFKDIFGTENCIGKICLGPKCKLKENDVKNFLDSKMFPIKENSETYGNIVHIEKSEIPYR